MAIPHRKKPAPAAVGAPENPSPPPASAGGAPSTPRASGAGNTAGRSRGNRSARSREGASVRAEKQRAEPVRLAAARAYLAFGRGEPFRENPPARITGEADRRLYVQLVRGVVRHKRLLEAELARLTTRPPEQQTPEAAALALLGLFQLRFLERVPPHAALHETVGLAAALGCGRAKGWVNAVLRRAQRESEAGADWLETLPPEVRHSHPEWMAARWRSHYGEQEAARLYEANNFGGGVTLRVERRRIDAGELARRLADEQVRATPHPLLPGSALKTEQTGALLRSRAFREGLCYVQDVASQVLAAWTAPLLKGAGAVLDGCAAPGGKLTQFAATAPPGTLLTGGDLTPARLALIRENFGRLRLPPRPLLRMDGRRLPFRPDSLGGLLLDVPCSATGMIRKYPELKWRKHERDLPGYVKLQEELLAEGALAVRPGGWLLYITCSLEPEENEENIAAFLAAHPAFRRALGDLAPPKGLGEPARGFLTDEGDFQVLPAADRMGLYAALLKRDGSGGQEADALAVSEQSSKE